MSLPSGFPDNAEVFLKPDEKDLKAEEIEKLLVGFYVVRLDGAAMKGKSELLAALAAGFKFPAYFGCNWDALLDCLRSLPDLVGARGYAVLVERSGLLLKDSPADLEDFRDIAETAAAFLLEKYKVPFKVALL